MSTATGFKLRHIHDILMMYQLFMFQNEIDMFFNWCVLVISIIGETTGMGYNLANIVIFVILQPSLILLFMFLWLKEKHKS